MDVSAAEEPRIAIGESAISCEELRWYCAMGETAMSCRAEGAVRGWTTGWGVLAAMGETAVSCLDGGARPSIVPKADVAGVERCGIGLRAMSWLVFFCDVDGAASARPAVD